VGTQRWEGVKVEIRVFATLRQYLPELKTGECLEFDLAPGCTLDDIRQTLGLPLEEISVVMRNGRQADLGDLAREGDRIAFAPAVAGG
jgi:sulfur-carrier protein